MTVPVPTGSAAKGRGGGTAEVSFFHQDVFLLDCDAEGGPAWSRLWPLPGTGPAPAPADLVQALPAELRSKGGGADAGALAIFGGAGASARAGEAQSAPRGRIAACCTAMDGHLWLFGGSCESGPRQEVTLDDLWRLELRVEEGGSGEVHCGERWECVLPLSDRATVWFDDSSDSEDEEDEEEEQEGSKAREVSTALMPVKNAGGGVLSKKQQKAEAKQARMEVKRERQQEKCEEKTSKRDEKKERQRMQALQARASG